MLRLERDTEKVISELSKIGSLTLPQNKAEKKRLKISLDEATDEYPLAIYVGSCPDYSHKNGFYTHKYIGNRVPLLTRIHLKYAARVLSILADFGVPYKYILMVADIEVVDEFFCRKFTGGSEVEFVKRCLGSMQSTAKLMSRLRQRHLFPDSDGIISSSFFTEFGREIFLGLQKEYQEKLQNQYDCNSTFAQRVRSDIIARMELYHTMYTEVLNGRGYLTSEEENFLVGRTIRTMAQYLTLGRLIAAASPHAVIINHPTKNITVFNDRNRFLLPGDGPQPQPTIPVIQIQRKVYK